MKTILTAENIVKCGCSNLIHKGLASVTGVYGVKVYPEKKEIVIDHTDEANGEILLKKLTDMGYVARIISCGNDGYL